MKIMYYENLELYGKLFTIPYQLFYTGDYCNCSWPFSVIYCIYMFWSVFVRRVLKVKFGLNYHELATTTKLLKYIASQLAQGQEGLRIWKSRPDYLQIFCVCKEEGHEYIAIIVYSNKKDFISCPDHTQSHLVALLIVFGASLSETRIYT